MKSSLNYSCRNILRTLTRLNLAIVLILFSLPAKLSAQSSIVQLYNPPLSKADSASGNGWMQFPRAFGFDVKQANGDLVRQILLSWGISEDNSAVTPVFNHRISPNGGVGYWARVTNQPTLNFGNALKKRDGKILCMPFDVVRDSSGVNERQFGLNYHISTDNGVTFTPQTGTLNFPFNVNWVKITRGVFESEGVLYMPFYAAYQGYSGTRCVIAKSLDQGQTWSWHADITNPTKDGSTSYDEVTVAACANGDWLAVFRQGQRVPIKYCRSPDKGVTWSAAAFLPGLGGTSTSADDFNESVDPFLQLMPNGMMILSYGRPNSHIAFSYDGNGTNWTYLATTFLEVPGVYSASTSGKQSSNYLAMVPLGYNRFMQYGDTGANWTYYSQASPFVNIPHPTPNPFSIWQKPFEIVTNRQNRIDLKKKILNNWVTVMPATTLTYADANHPETRPLGAVDGSMDYWSSAIGTSSGVYQLDLQKTYRLNSVGLGMLYEKQQSATVQYATAANPTTWVTLATYTNEIHRNINYTDFTPVDARYIKVTVSGSGQVGIGELELYEASSTFEANAATPTSTIHGVMPPGYTFYGGSATAHGMSVRDVYGYQSNRALTLYDGNNSYMAGIKKIESASNKKTLEYRFRAVTVPANQMITMRILGTVSGAENVVFYLAVFPDGSLKANEGAGFNKVIAAAGTFGISSTSPWKTIKIIADAAAHTASVEIDGTPTGINCTTFPAAASVTNLTGFGFTSYGTATWGEIAYFDDINLYDPTIEVPSGIASASATTAIFSSSLVPQKQTESNAFSISVSPNPAREVVKIVVKGASRGVLNIQFTSLWGKKSKQLKYSLEDGSSELNVPIGELSQGLYVLTATQNGHVSQTKLIVK
jgi:hypothetical protein